MIELDAALTPATGLPILKLPRLPSPGHLPTGVLPHDGQEAPADEPL